MSYYIKNTDPFHHAVTTSLGQHLLWANLWKMETIDIAQQHSYIDYSSFSRTLEENNAAIFLYEAREKLLQFGKPILMAEFGYSGTNEYNPLNDKDKYGMALHNSIWAGLFLGYSGTPMLWWWDNYIDKNKLYYHYSALSKFISVADWSLKKRFFSNLNDKEIRIFGIRDSKHTFLWLQNNNSTWHKTIVERKRPELIKNLAIRLNGFKQKSYKIEWFDTLKGKVVLSQKLSPEGENLKIDIPSFRFDIAARIFRENKRIKK
jgi:hypothetical protein